MADDGSLVFQALMKGVNEICKHTFPLQQRPWDCLILHSREPTVPYLHQLSGCLLKTCISLLHQNWDFLRSFELLILRCCKEEWTEPLWCGSWQSSILLAGPPEDLTCGTGSQTASLGQTSPGASLGGTCRNTEWFYFKSICNILPRYRGSALIMT